MRDDLARFLQDELGADAGPPDGGAWTITTPLWIWRGSGDGPPPKAAWYFLTIDGDAAAAIRAAAGPTGGWGSVRVQAQIGATSWTTSLFPSKEAGGYLLPVKAAVRCATGIADGAAVTVSLSLA
jgi:hypothetical protein